MLVFGHSGIPIVLFPTSNGRYYQNKDFGLIGSVQHFIDNGLIRIYCIDSVDELSWYNKGIHPADRVRNHMWYDKMLNEELVPRTKYETNHGKVAMAGCSFGAYHATNYAFRYPWDTSHLFNMGGAFDIRMQTDGFHNEDVYYNNPIEFLPNMHHADLYHMGIALGVGEHDFCKPSNEALSHILSSKGVRHWLDIAPGETHDWPVWRNMFPKYVSQMFQ